MLDDLDSFDDIPLPTTTTTERRPGKFRPRTRAKTATVASTTPKISDAAQLVPPSPQPSAQDSDFNLEMERTGHEPGLSNYSVVAGGFLDTSRQSQGSLGQMLASACVPLMAPQVHLVIFALAEFSTMESPRYTGGTAGVRRAGKFQPENISQPNKGTANIHNPRLHCRISDGSHDRVGKEVKFLSFVGSKLRTELTNETTDDGLVIISHGTDGKN
ncbi:unnamed protein product [Musa acuminata var. zebrina]